MSLIRRRKNPNPAERALGYVRLGLKGLVAQRVARKAYKGYKVGKKLPLLIGVGAAGAVAAKKLSGSGSGSDSGYTPPPSPGPAQASAPAAGTAPTPPPPAAEAAPEPPAPDPAADDDGAAPVENTEKVDEVLDNEATTPLTPAAAGTGGAEGEGVPSDEESAEASGESTDAAPPKD